jgi:predicted nucleotidyltransferase
MTEPTQAEKMYERHLAYLRRYNATHKEMLKASAKRYYDTIKADPEKYAKYLERKREHARKYRDKKLNKSTTNYLSDHNLNYLCKNYLGLGKGHIDKILKTNDRSCCVLNNPRVVITDKLAFAVRR